MTSKYVLKHLDCLIMYVDVNLSYQIILNINDYANWEGQIIKVSVGGLSKSIVNL